MWLHRGFLSLFNMQIKIISLSPTQNFDGTNKEKCSRIIVSKTWNIISIRTHRKSRRCFNSSKITMKRMIRSLLLIQVRAQVRIIVLMGNITQAVNPATINKMRCSCQARILINRVLKSRILFGQRMRIKGELMKTILRNMSFVLLQTVMPFNKTRKKANIHSLLLKVIRFL